MKGQADLERIATLAANDDEAIGSAIAEAVTRSARTAWSPPRSPTTLGLSVDVVDGIEFDHGYISPYMVTDRERMEAVYDNPVILLTNKKITQVQDIMPTVEAAKRADRPLVILAEDVDGPALQLLVGGNMHGTMQSVVVRAPGFGHRRVAELEDLAVALGGRVVAKDTGIELHEVSADHLGTCDRITITENETTIVGAHGDAALVEARISQLETQFERAKIDGDQDTLQMRLARHDRPGRRDQRRGSHERRAQGAHAPRRGLPRRDPCRTARRAIVAGGAPRWPRPRTPSPASS